MKRTMLLLALAAVISGARAQKAPADLIIRSVSVIDVERGRTTPNQAVAVKNGRIIAVAPGMQADLLLLDAHPLENIRNTLQIRGLVSRGKWRDREYLDYLLAETARRTAAGL